MSKLPKKRKTYPLINLNNKQDLYLFIYFYKDKVIKQILPQA